MPTLETKLYNLGNRIEQQGKLISFGASRYAQDKIDLKNTFKYMDSNILYIEQIIRELKDLALTSGYPMYGLANGTVELERDTFDKVLWFITELVETWGPEVPNYVADHADNILGMLLVKQPTDKQAELAEGLMQRAYDDYRDKQEYMNAGRDTVNTRA